MAPSATADLQGLDYRIVANNAVAGDNNWTVEIYAVLDNGSRLDAVAGDGKLQDKRLAISGGSILPKRVWWSILQQQ